jgi:TPR repeat protein
MSIKSIRRWVVVSLLSAFAGIAAAQAPNASIHNTRSQKILAAMDHTSTQGHPDLYGEFNGMQRYAAGHYKAAMKYFLIGARFADKLSQLSIGLMYLNGEGVKKDPVTAFAWIAIAAERKYPGFITTRDALWAKLDGQQRTQAKALIEKLYPEYGDLVAKSRMAKRLRWNRSDMTGSYLGGPVGGPMSSLTPGQFTGTGPMPPCGADTIDGLPITGCGNLAQADWYWNPKDYFRVRDAEWTGTVTIGKVKQGKSSTPAGQ